MASAAEGPGEGGRIGAKGTSSVNSDWMLSLSQQKKPPVQALMDKGLISRKTLSGSGKARRMRLRSSADSRDRRVCDCGNTR